MLNVTSIIFIFFTVVFLLVSRGLLFRKVQLPHNKVYFNTNGKGINVFDPNKKKRVVWGYLCFVLSILSMFLSIIFSGHIIVSPPFDQAQVVPANETPHPSSSIWVSTSPVATPYPSGTVQAVLSSDIWLDELPPLSPLPGNFYLGGWGDKTAFNLNGIEYDHGVGMCIVGSKSEKMAEAKDAYQNNPRWDCREASLLLQFGRKYDNLTFSVGVDSGDRTVFGPSDDNGVVQVVIKDWSTKEELFNTGYQDYTYATSNIEIDVSRVDVLQIIVRSGSVNGKRITKSLRFVLVNPTLTLSES